MQEKEVCSFQYAVCSKNKKVTDRIKKELQMEMTR